MLSLKKMDQLINRYRTSINPPYKFKDYLNLTLTFLLVLILPVTIFLAQRPQDIRQRAQEITKPHGKAETPSVPDEILVKFKPGVNEKGKDNAMKAYGLSKKDTIAGVDVMVAKVPEKAKEKVLKALQHNPKVEYAEPNYILQTFATPNDPAFPNQWDLRILNAATAWDISTGSSSAVIAVLDSGAKTDHQDLVGKFVQGYNFLSNNTDITDTFGHGTVVSGIAGATTNNAVGMGSLNWNDRLMELKIVDVTGTTTNSRAATATTYAADHGAKVVNMSFGGNSATAAATLQNSINYAWSKGVVLAAAAGNGGTCCIVYPAAGDHVIAVGATDGSDVKASFSSTGQGLDVVAPGMGVISTTLTGIYSQFSGTSYATPFVSALASLIMSANPGLTNQQVVDIITGTAKDLGAPGWDEQYGFGRIQADVALQAATGITPPPPDTTSPTASISSPTDGSPVSGSTVGITVAASDNVAVTKVEVYIDGVLLGSTLTSPYDFIWDTTSVTNGSHTMVAKAYDLAGNPPGTSSITVTVNNPVPDTTPPIVSINSPADGQSILGTVAVSATASDNIAVSSVSFFADGAFIGEATTSPYQTSFDTLSFANGVHTLTAIAFDSSNNSTSSGGVSVSIANTLSSPTPIPTETPIPTFTPMPTPTSMPIPVLSDTILPSVSINAPLTGAVINRSATITVAATASDDIGVTKVEFSVNGSLKNTDSVSPYSFTYKLPGTPNAKYTITAKAYDGAGNTSTSTVTITSSR